MYIYIVIIIPVLRCLDANMSMIKVSVLLSVCMRSSECIDRHVVSVVRVDVANSS